MIGNFASSPHLTGSRQRRASWQWWDPDNWIVLESAPAVDVTVNDATHGHSTDALTVEQAIPISAADAVQAQSTDALTLVQILVVAPFYTGHTQTTDSLALVQVHIVQLDDTYHTHSPETVSFTLPLTAAETSHAHSPDNATVVQTHIVGPAEALQLHSAEVPIPTPTITVADADHTHSADIVSLGDTIAVHDAVHAMSSDSPTMVVIIAINDAAQAQTAEQASVSAGGSLLVDDAGHSMTSDEQWVLYEEVIMNILELYNTALGLVGHDTISDVQDTTKAGRFLNLLWPTVRKTVLRSHPWNIARKRVVLDTPDSTAPAFEWAYRFALPSDCLRVLGRLDSDEPWLVEGNFVLTNTTSIALRYIADVTDPAAYDSLLTEAMYTCLAAKLALPLAGSKELAQMLDAAFQDVLNSARHVDATESIPPNVVADTWERARA